MGPSNANRKRPTEFTRKAIGQRTAWHKAYKHHNLSNIITGKIPKVIRAIDSAKARLKKARTEKAADVECRHLERSLLAINDSYTKIRNILREGNDMHRWNEFPGLEAVVNQVDSIVWSDLKGKGIPGGRVEFDLPKFDNGTSLSKAKAKKPKSVATDIVDKSKSTQTQSPNKPGLSMETKSSKLHPRPEFAGPDDQQQHLHHFNALIRLILHIPGKSPCNRTTIPMSSPTMSCLTTRSTTASLDPADLIMGNPNLESQAVLVNPSLMPSHSLPRLEGITALHLFAPQKPPVTLETLSTSELGPVIAKQPDNQQLCKRESPDPLEPSISDHQRCKRESSDSVQPLESGHPRLLKRRRAVGTETVSEADDPQSSKRRPLRLPNGLPDSDFGTWFEHKVTRNKNKLSRIRSDLGASGSPR
ncbi:hypothetical protein J7T55_014822 [Diaporthe amygdali]|uniref:uncharacterized protein n=1 Tax=Phomopsis amygdali TaxID=1214568 RepID=UPI0022FDDA9D|nr:uncharacterized protein J7T55_014822 [Diaporthe amygdali]KAJ0110019.1 hypothetical protein J7T55_014822 [Diaporthe amygdali]